MPTTEEKFEFPMTQVIDKYRAKCGTNNIAGDGLLGALGIG